MDSDGQVIGVCQVMNKLHGRVFTEDDVAIIEVHILARVIIDMEPSPSISSRRFPSSAGWAFTTLVNTSMWHV